MIAAAVLAECTEARSYWLLAQPLPRRVGGHGNALGHIPDSYMRYLEHTFRKVFKLQGTPLRVQFRTAENPYDKDDAKHKPKISLLARFKNKQAEMKTKKAGVKSKLAEIAVKPTEAKPKPKANRSKNTSKK